MLLNRTSLHIPLLSDCQMNYMKSLFSRFLLDNFRYTGFFTQTYSLWLLVNKPIGPIFFFLYISILPIIFCYSDDGTLNASETSMQYLLNLLLMKTLFYLIILLIYYFIFFFSFLLFVYLLYFSIYFFFLYFVALFFIRLVSPFSFYLVVSHSDWLTDLLAVCSNMSPFLPFSSNLFPTQYFP